MNEHAIRDAIQAGRQARSYTDVVDELLAAGVRIYHTDLASGVVIYNSDAAFCFDRRPHPCAVNERPDDFLPRQITAAVRALGVGELDERGFEHELWRAGVVEYEVNLLWRDITFVGPHRERWVERIPRADRATTRQGVLVG